jgi:predicted dehydrogenase
MNLLWWYDQTEGPRTAGWKRIMCTSAGTHPYAEAWWPDAHVLGYEHAFINMVADMMNALGGAKPVVPLPDFADAYETQRVLEAAMLAAENRCAVKLSEVK